MQTFSAHNILLRAEMIAKSADVKLMVSAPFGILPTHFKRWKSYRNKEEIQLLHVLPCRCGNVDSSLERCTCTSKSDLPNLYKDRNRRHFYEEGYPMYLSLSYVDLDEYAELYKEQEEAIVSSINLDTSRLLKVSKEGDEILQMAKKRFRFLKEDTIKAANAIEYINAHNNKKAKEPKEISKGSILEALSYRMR